jgi:hypothetical protein
VSTSLGDMAKFEKREKIEREIHVTFSRAKGKMLPNLKAGSKGNPKGNGWA